jgi:hypothetical protein
MGKPLQPWTPFGARGRRDSGLMHLQFVSQRRLRAKQALYKLTEVIRWPGREPNQIRAVDERYNLAVYGQYRAPAPHEAGLLEASLTSAPMNTWWKGYEHLMRHFHPSGEPWQEAEVLRLLAEHGREKFAGLDLFGAA